MSALFAALLMGLAAAAIVQAPAANAVAPTEPVVTAQPGNGSASLSFADPGDPTNHYESTIDGGATFQPLDTTPDGTGKLVGTINGLANGTTYAVQVRGYNAEGTGTVSAPVQVTPGQAAAPVLRALPVDHGFTVTFAPPSDGGVPITGYETSVTTDDTLDYRALPYDVTDDGAGKRTVSIRVTGLQNAQLYNVSVRAVNATGPGRPGTTSVTPDVAPDPPTDVTATAGYLAAVVSFSTPVPNGGTAPVSYEATSNDGKSATCTASPCEVTGLTKGTSYTFTVTARNQSFTSVASAPSAAVVVSGPADVRNPSITARLSSASGKTRYGWYRSAVTVRFNCVAGSAPLATTCPAPVVLRSGVNRSVTRSVTATDGGKATATVRGIDIDSTRPTVALAGPRSGATYAGRAPRARCKAADHVSGIASCTITRRAHGTHATYRATAVDRAGNRRSRSVTVTVRNIYLADARLRGDAFDVRVGRKYTLVVSGTSHRPVYYDAAVHPRRPAPRDRAFRAAGHRRWVLVVRMQRSLTTHRYWNLGVKIGRTLHSVKIRVV